MVVDAQGSEIQHIEDTDKATEKPPPPSPLVGCLSVESTRLVLAHKERRRRKENKKSRRKFGFRSLIRCDLRTILFPNISVPTIVTIIFLIDLHIFPLPLTISLGLGVWLFEIEKLDLHFDASSSI